MAGYAMWRAPSASKNLADLAAPDRSTPASVLKVLGKRDVYSDKALFEKYWEHFGKELEQKGPKGDIQDKELEQRFVSALHDLYAESKAPGANIFGLDKKTGDLTGRPGKGAFAAGAGMALIGSAAPVVSSTLWDQIRRGALSESFPLGPAMLAATPDVLSNLPPPPMQTVQKNMRWLAITTSRCQSTITGEVYTRQGPPALVRNRGAGLLP